MRGVVVVVALGNFDGVHLGHRAVVWRAVKEGHERDARVVAATFEPHPRAVLRPGMEPKLLTTPEVRRELLLACGADEVRAIPFDQELSKKSPGEFVGDVLVGELGAGVVVVGENFRFGHRASGDFEELEKHMREAGGEAVAVGIEGPSGAGISSSRIRALIAEGEMNEANELLGHPYLVRGEVVVGDLRGRTIGFPTANVLPDERQLVPGRGVYAGRVRVGEHWHAACANVGVAPTFDRRESKVEAHILDFDGDLYGRTLDVVFVRRLRAEKKFSGIEELRDQIARDVEEARRVLASREKHDSDKGANRPPF